MQAHCCFPVDMPSDISLSLAAGLHTIDVLEGHDQGHPALRLKLSWLCLVFDCLRYSHRFISALSLINILLMLQVPVQQHGSNRREAVGLLASAAAMLMATPAQAFLGFGEPSENDTYTADTVRDCSGLECGVRHCRSRALATLSIISSCT